MQRSTANAAHWTAAPPHRADAAFATRPKHVPEHAMNHPAAVYPIDPEFAAKARVHARGLRAPVRRVGRRIRNAFWGRVAKRLDWFAKRRPRSRTSATTSADFHIRWYEDGELNASVNCLDRHLAARGDKTALIFEQDDPSKQPAERITYRELHARVCQPRQCAAQRSGVREGRPRHHLPADDSRSGGGDARLRARRRDPLGGVRRLRAAARSPTASPTAPASSSSPPTKACAAARRFRSRPTSMRR